jgi:hypothetical protein
LVAVRLAASAAMGAYSISQDPTNEYLKLHALPAQVGLQQLLAMDQRKVQTLVHLVNSNAAEFPLCSEVVCGLLGAGGDSSEQYFSTSVAAVCGVKREREREREGRREGEEGSEEAQAPLPTLTFVTGNAKKLEEVQRILGDSLRGFRLVSQKVDLPELQGAPEEVSAQKCRLVAAQVHVCLSVCVCVCFMYVSCVCVCLMCVCVSCVLLCCLLE